MAEVLLDAYSQVSGKPTEFPNYPKDWRAVQLPDSKVDSYFLASFGRADRDQTCTCERTTEPSVGQVLHLFNGDAINKKLAAKENRIAKALVAKTAPEMIVEEAYLSALSRFPTTEESQRMTSVLKDAPETEKRAVVEDIYWALLSSKEFIFNH